MNKILYSSIMYSNPDKDMIDSVKIGLIDEKIVDSENDITNDLIYEQLMFRKNEDCFEFISSVEQYDNKVNATFTIVGSLGLLDGRKEIIPVTTNSLANAIDKIIDNSSFDCDIVIKETPQGRMLIDVYHHDGVNKFAIYRKDKGKNYSKNIWFYKKTGWYIGYEE